MKKMLLGLGAVLVLGVCGAAQADPITVPNAGFEDRATFDPFGDGIDKYPQPSRES